MTREEKWEIGIGVGVVAIVLLLAWKHGQTASADNTTPLNIPTIGGSQPSSGSTTLPAITVQYQPGNSYNVNVAGDNVSTGNGTLCSCGCNNSASFFGMDQLLQSYADALNNATSSYYDTLISSIPKTISQFLNNPTGYEQAMSVYSLVDML